LRYRHYPAAWKRLFASNSDRAFGFDLTGVLVEIGLVSAEDDFSSTVLYGTRASDNANRHPNLDISFQVDHGGIMNPSINLDGRDHQVLRAACDWYREVFPFTGGIVLSG